MNAAYEKKIAKKFSQVVESFIFWLKSIEILVLVKF